MFIIDRSIYSLPGVHVEPISNVQKLRRCRSLAGRYRIMQKAPQCLVSGLACRDYFSSMPNAYVQSDAARNSGRFSWSALNWLSRAAMLHSELLESGCPVSDYEKLRAAAFTTCCRSPLSCSYCHTIGLWAPISGSLLWSAFHSTVRGHRVQKPPFSPSE